MCELCDAESKYLGQIVTGFHLCRAGKTLEEPHIIWNKGDLCITITNRAVFPLGDNGSTLTAKDIAYSLFGELILCVTFLESCKSCGFEEPDGIKDLDIRLGEWLLPKIQRLLEQEAQGK